jgi:REP element-mobilizing transposase RayT
MRPRGRQRAFEFRSWGGRRAGAGREPAGPRGRVSHDARPAHDARHPLHATLRTIDGLPSLRARRVFAAVRAAIAAASAARFRVVEFSVQRNHLHLLVEGDDRSALVRGLQGLAIRVARAVNRVIRRRGGVFGDRYHARALKTPNEVRRALVYVLQNWRKHGFRGLGIDACSSAAWFRGWARPLPQPSMSSPVARARTWLLATGWRRYGPLDVAMRPAGAL